MTLKRQTGIDFNFFRVLPVAHVLQFLYLEVLERERERIPGEAPSCIHMWKSLWPTSVSGTKRSSSNVSNATDDNSPGKAHAAEKTGRKRSSSRIRVLA